MWDWIRIHSYGTPHMRRDESRFELHTTQKKPPLYARLPEDIGSAVSRVHRGGLACARVGKGRS
jgi:hypothetical protein